MTNIPVGGLGGAEPLARCHWRRPIEVAHAWACRMLNVFGSREVLFHPMTIKMLLMLLGSDKDERAPGPWDARAPKNRYTRAGVAQTHAGKSSVKVYWPVFRWYSAELHHPPSASLPPSASPPHTTTVPPVL